MALNEIKIPFQDLKDSVKVLTTEYHQAAKEVIESGRFLNGPQTESLEKKLADICGARYAVTTSTGLDALRLILQGYISLGKLKKGDEVIVPANTFIATFLAVTACGLTAVAADIDEDDFNLDFHNLPITDRTKAVIPVHLYGNPCWDPNIFEELRAKGILIIEDNAQAVGAMAKDNGFNGNRMTGNLGDAAAISFYPAKNIGALGDAGAILTSDETLAQTVRKLRNYGSEEKYHHELLGFNCRMDELQAAFLNIALDRLEEISDSRRQRAILYDKTIVNSNIVKPKIFNDRKQVWHQYVIRHPHRDELREYLRKHGIATEIHYPVPSHLQPCYLTADTDSKIIHGDLKVTELLAREILSLPIANVSEKDIIEIASVLNRFPN